MHVIYFNKLKTQHQILIINLQTYQVCNLHACSRARYSQILLIILLFINNYVTLYTDQSFVNVLHKSRHRHTNHLEKWSNHKKILMIHRT